MTALTTLLVILGLAFGGTGATVYAAQGSQPDQPLYPVKILSEDLRFQLTTQEQSQLELALQFASRRVEEAAQMTAAGENPPEAVLSRWQQEMDLALWLAAGQQDADLVAALEQIQTRLRDQEQMMTQTGVCVNTEAACEQLRLRLQDRLRLTEDGLMAPETFQQRLRTGVQQTPSASQTPFQAGGNGSGTPCVEGTPAPGSGSGAGNGAGNGGNPGWSASVTPGSGMGAPTSTMMNGADAGNGESYRYRITQTGTPSGDGGSGGNTPWTETTPTPGSGYGPGPGPDATCTPGSGPGPMETQPAGPNPQMTPGSGGGGPGGGGGGNH